MRNFFIDLENVRSYGLEGVLLLKPDDKVYVFYSDNANALTIPTIESLNESPAVVKYIKTNYIGANAMDFQIVTLLGATIEQQKKGSFYIISHDNGFKSAVKFCEGYFTGYDIITGVFANILLALNSETSKEGSSNSAQAKNGKTKKSNSKQNSEINNAKAADKPASQQKASGKEAQSAVSGEGEQGTPDSEERSGRSRRKRHKKQDNSKNTDVIQAKENLSADENTVRENPVKENSAKGNSAKENSVKESPEGNEGVTETKDASAVQSENTKSRHRQNRSKRKNQDSAEGVNEQSRDAQGQKPEAEVTMTEEKKTAVSSETQNTPDSDNKKQKSSKHDKHKKKNGSDDKGEAADGKPVSTGAEKESSGEPKSMKYVYNALSDYLSKTTIDMYAKKIDEGIRKSSNRNELHEFFRKSYGTDEAEALFKVVSSDFDEMKKHVK